MDAVSHMPASLASSWRSFWHSMTTNDRHASYNSPYRSGQHVPLSQSRHAPLTSVATNAMESRTDLAQDDTGFINHNNAPVSPQTPYSPGMRSTMQRTHSQQDTSYSANAMSGADVQMQSFQEGLPPPPPVPHSWKRLDRWFEDHYEELFENIGEGCTQNDVNELEHDLDCSLPQDVRESLQVHDGQERGGRPTGAIFGCMLLDCEEIVQEWNQWRRTNEEYLRENSSHASVQAPSKAFAGAASSSTSAASAAPVQQSGSSNWRSDLNSRQDSQPANAIQKAYVHPAWIPLARDWGGNNICVDLAPGPTGKWGQVILMGRDYDCKYVVARSWGAFLANVADDLSTDKWFIDEETQELKLREFPKQQDVQPAYMDILRWRADQKYGRRQPAPRSSGGGGGKKAMPPLKINSQVKNDFSGLNGFSPYASPASATADDRGRSPPRFSTHGKGPAQSSPLARVAEEAPSNGPVTVAPVAQRSAGDKLDKLVSIDSPVIGSRNSGEEMNLLGDARSSKGTDTPVPAETPSAESADAFGLASAKGGAAQDEMKTVQI